VLAAAALAAVVVTIPATARAGALERDCTELERARRTSCQLDRDQSGAWVLTTRLVVGSGAKREVASLERQFCDAMRARGKAARVTRWNALPGDEGRAAKMEWSCLAPPTPSVSSAPPRMPRYGGAYLR
jgi:hypothetical protein